MAQLSDFLTACIEIKNNDDSTTWIPVDLEIATEDANYQIFNTFTGQHDFFDTLVLAKEKWNSLKEEIINTYLNAPQTAVTLVPDSLFRDTPLPINDDTESTTVDPEVTSF